MRKRSRLITSMRCFSYPVTISFCLEREKHQDSVKEEKMKTFLTLCVLFLAGAVLLCSAQEEHDISVRSLKQKPKLQDTCRGLHGLPGRDGRDGRDAGLRGRPGKSGPKGSRGPRGPAGKSGIVTGGAVYTRWGKKACPKTAQTTQLYSGVMAGTWYADPGGGSNYLCLPLNPIYEKVKGGNQGSMYIHGTEYEVSNQKNIFQNSNLPDHDAPCAVCHTESRGSHMMIPARNVCPSGWTMEYKGYLMSEHHGHKGRTQFICVDGNAEATHGSHINKNGALLYFVEGYCSYSLPCPPYVQGYELTCVVCTK